MQLTDILTNLFVSQKRAARVLGHGLTLTIEPGVAFRAGRPGVFPSATEIKTLIASAQKVGVKLAANPTLKYVDDPHGTQWGVAEWDLRAAEVVKL